MAHPHHGDRYYIIVDNKTNQARYDDWGDIIGFNTKAEAREYIEEYELEETHHVDTWLDY